MTRLVEEIHQQPAALSGLRKFYCCSGVIPYKLLRKLVADWPPTVIFTGMGSSLCAAYPAQAYLSAAGIRSVVWETAELIDQRLGFLGPDSLLVVISQSGETEEVRRLLEKLPGKRGVVAVCNVEGSTLARHAKVLLPLMAGAPKTASSKAYMCTVSVLMYFAFALSRRNAAPLTQTLKQAIDEQEEILDRQELVIPPMAEFFDNPPYVALMGRGADIATIEQGALMLKEMAHLGAEAISASQFRHGPIEIVNPAHRYVIVARQGKTSKSLLKLSDDLRRRGGRVLLFTDQSFSDVANVKLVRVKTLRLGLGTLVDSLYIQLLAYALARRAGLEPGEPRPATVDHGE